MTSVLKTIFLVFLIGTFLLGGYIYAKNVDIKTLFYEMGHKEQFEDTVQTTPTGTPTTTNGSLAMYGSTVTPIPTGTGGPEEEDCEGDDCDEEDCDGEDCPEEEDCEGEDCPEEEDCEGEDCPDAEMGAVQGNNINTNGTSGVGGYIGSNGRSRNGGGGGNGGSNQYAGSNVYRTGGGNGNGGGGSRNNNNNDPEAADENTFNNGNSVNSTQHKSTNSINANTSSPNITYANTSSPMTTTAYDSYSYADQIATYANQATPTATITGVYSSGSSNASNITAASANVANNYANYAPISSNGANPSGIADPTCPTNLLYKNGQYLLFNTNIPQQYGINPLVFQTLDAYNEYYAQRQSAGINCPNLNQNAPPLQVAGTTDDRGLISDVIDASREDPPFNQNNYAGFDPWGFDEGKMTTLDKIHYIGETVPVSDNPMDPNWGGVLFTQQVVDAGKYADYNVVKPLYPNPKGLPVAVNASQGTQTRINVE